MEHDATKHLVSPGGAWTSELRWRVNERGVAFSRGHAVAGIVVRRMNLPEDEGRTGGTLAEFVGEQMSLVYETHPRCWD